MAGWDAQPGEGGGRWLADRLSSKLTIDAVGMQIFPIKSKT